MVKHNVILIVLRWQVGKELFHFLLSLEQLVASVRSLNTPSFSSWCLAGRWRDGPCGSLSGTPTCSAATTSWARWWCRWLARCSTTLLPSGTVSRTGWVSAATATTRTTSSSLTSFRLNPRRTSPSSTRRETSSSPSSTFPRSPHWSSARRGKEHWWWRSLKLKTCQYRRVPSSLTHTAKGENLEINFYQNSNFNLTLESCTWLLLCCVGRPSRLLFYSWY